MGNESRVAATTRVAYDDVASLGINVPFVGFTCVCLPGSDYQKGPCDYSRSSLMSELQSRYHCDAL